MFDNKNMGVTLATERKDAIVPGEKKTVDFKVGENNLTKVPGGKGLTKIVSNKEGLITNMSKEIFSSFKKNKKDVAFIEIDRIRPNPYQPRKRFNAASLNELSNSIKTYGVLQPISVRKISNDAYELIAGERRLRASMMAGLEKIPAIMVKVGENDSAMLALIENIQRENLSYIEEAEAYQKLLIQSDLTQEQLALRVGKSQSTVANKLRLLKLSERVRREISNHDLTERHARALLKVESEELQLKIIKTVMDKGLNVKRTEELVENMYTRYVDEEMEQQAINRKVSRVVKDIRIFVNTVKQAINMMREAGVNAKAAQFDKGDYIEFIIRIPKKQTPAANMKKVS